MTWKFAVEYFSKKFEIEHTLGTEILNDGKIKHSWPETKSEFLFSLIENYGIELKSTAAVGDSYGNKYMLGSADYSIFVGASMPTDMKVNEPIFNAGINSVCERIVKRFK